MSGPGGEKANFTWVWTLLFAAAAAAAGFWGFQEHRKAIDLEFEKHRLALLQTENDRLHAVLDGREKEAARTADEAKRKAIEAAVVEIRGVGFKQPVTYDVMTREGLKKVLEQKLGEQYSSQDFKNAQAGLTAFGLLEPGYDLKEKYIALLGEQVAAFYDQHQHRLFMFEDASLASMQNCIVLAHELTHALQDQNFDILKLPLEVKNNDDLALATSALIEGDATVVMNDYTMKNFSLKALRESLSGVYAQNMDQLKTAPRYLREALVFPYLRGQEFCTYLMESGGGYDAISQAFKNPPVSTTQILHPEKYLAHEMPIRIDWPDTTVSGKNAMDDNVMGEFGIRVLFSQFIDAETGKAAAAGWRGDRYLVYDDGKALVWKTIWEDPEHAKRFRDALSSYVQKRFKALLTNVDGDDISFTSAEGPGKICHAKTENGVILIWASTKEMKDALLEKFKE